MYNKINDEEKDKINLFLYQFIKINIDINNFYKMNKVDGFLNLSHYKINFLKYICKEKNIKINNNESRQSIENKLLNR